MDRQYRIKSGGPLYLIADRKPEEAFEGFLLKLESALMGGVRLVQYRNKEASTKVYYEEALVVQKRLKAFEGLFICNDRIDIALAIGADGVHIGQSDLPLEVVRQVVGEKMLIGQTCKTPEAFRGAEVNGADYIGTGAYFPTSTKKDAALLTHQQLANLIKYTTLPVYGIGGVSIENMNAVLETGAYGVAISSAIMTSESPEQSVRLALERLKHFV